MAYTIKTTPTNPNIANNNLVYVASSSNATQPQYQYVVDVKDNDDNLIQRIKQQPNVNDEAVFDIGKIISLNVTSSIDAAYSQNSLTTSQFACGDKFKIYFGEEYGTSVTSSITLYDGNGGAGSPAVTSSEYLFVTNGVINIEEQVNGFNFDSGSYLNFNFLLATPQLQDTTPTNPEGIVYYDFDQSPLIKDVALTTSPRTQSVRDFDYHTISLYLGDAGVGEFYYGQLPYIARVTMYRANGTVSNTLDYSIGQNSDIISGNSLSVNGSPNYGFLTWNKDKSITQNSSSLVAHVGVGPQNLLDADPGAKPFERSLSETAYYDVKFIGYQNPFPYFFSGGRTTSNPTYKSSFAYANLDELGAITILSSTATGVTGSYPTATVSTLITDVLGNSAVAYHTQSDVTVFGYPAASARQVAQDINDCAALNGLAVTASYYDGFAQCPTCTEAFPGNVNFGNISDLLQVTSTTFSTNELRLDPNDWDPFGYACIGDSPSGMGMGYSARGGADGYTEDLQYGTFRFNVISEETGFASPLSHTTGYCGYDGVRFAWKNKFGVWDYFTFPLAEEIVDNIERKEYEQTFVNFNTGERDSLRRGKTQYQNKITKQYKIESDWLSQDNADFLMELFKSTQVYVQTRAPQRTGTYSVEEYDGIFQPVVITNASVTEKTNPRTQKLFRYSAEYQYANEITPRV